MKKEIVIHLVPLILLMVIVTLLRRYFNLSFWPFWVGGVVGTVLPDLDHLIYAYFLRPQEFVSQKTNYLVEKKDIWGTLNFLSETRYERTKIIFHSANFQVIFLVLSFLVLTSSGSLFGEGLVLAFLLHLIVDQIVDLTSTGNLSNWFVGFPLNVEGKEKLYFGLGIVIFLIFTILL